MASLGYIVRYCLNKQLHLSHSTNQDKFISSKTKIALHLARQKCNINHILLVFMVFLGGGEVGENWDTGPDWPQTSHISEDELNTLSSWLDYKHLTSHVARMWLGYVSLNGRALNSVACLTVASRNLLTQPPSARIIGRNHHTYEDFFRLLP